MCQMKKEHLGPFLCFVHSIWRLLAFALPGLFVGPVVFPWHKATALVVLSILSDSNPYTEGDMQACISGNSGVAVCVVR